MERRRVYLTEASGLIKRTWQRQIDFIRTKLEKAECSGFITDSKEQVLAASKSLLNNQGYKERE